MAKEKKNVYTGTGHRKTSVARVTLTPGTGKITVNGKDVHDYLPFEVLVMDLCQPLDVTNTSTNLITAQQNYIQALTSMVNAHINLKNLLNK